MAAKISLDLSSGLKMPAIGLGTFMAKDENELKTVLNYALEVGYRHIDTALFYENEAVIGSVLKEWLSSGKLKREELFITTKLPPIGVHPDKVETFMKKSLENLQLDYVDLYLIHFPVYISVVNKKTTTLPTDHVAVWKKMEEQVDAGRAKSIGLSNFNIRQIDRILKIARIKPAVLQVEIHVFLQQRELVNFCQKNGVNVIAYAPLGTPGHNKYLNSLGLESKELPNMLQNTTIADIGKKHKKTNAQVMLRHLLQRNIAAIPKSVTTSRLKENIDVFGFVLDAEDMKKLDKLDNGEESRACDFRTIGGQDHPEWPFPKV